MLVLILVHSPSKYCKEIFNQKYEISSSGGLFSMLQVWFINYKRTIIDRFAFPDKSTAKSTGLCASTVTELKLDIDVETLQIMLILSNYWMQYHY